jgi:hypothetical protein
MTSHPGKILEDTCTMKPGFGAIPFTGASRYSRSYIHGQQVLSPTRFCFS